MKFFSGSYDRVEGSTFNKNFYVVMANTMELLILKKG